MSTVEFRVPSGRILPFFMAAQYEVGEIIGRGATGVVRRGRQVSPLRRDVAFKILRDDLAGDEGARVRFLEIEAIVSAARRSSRPSCATAKCWWGTSATVALCNFATTPCAA